MKRAVIEAARCRIEHKLIKRIGYDNFKIAQPYIEDLIASLTGVTPRRVVLPGEPEQQQRDPWHATPMQWQLDGKTVDVAIKEVI